MRRRSIHEFREWSGGVFRFKGCHTIRGLRVTCWQLDGIFPVLVDWWDVIARTRCLSVRDDGLNVDRGRLRLSVLLTFTQFPQFPQVRHEVCRARFSTSASSYLPCT